jgi:hypothetical protein
MNAEDARKARVMDNIRLNQTRIVLLCIHRTFKVQFFEKIATCASGFFCH